jgi:hypothetical protein
MFVNPLGLKLEIPAKCVDDFVWPAWPADEHTHTHGRLFGGGLVRQKVFERGFKRRIRQENPRHTVL